MKTTPIQSTSTERYGTQKGGDLLRVVYMTALSQAFDTIGVNATLMGLSLSDESDGVLPLGFESTTLNHLLKG